jgi:uncharacterized protein
VTDPAQADKVFLSAEWRQLVFLNYAVYPTLLRNYVPRGTLLDSFDGKTYISLVGFRFCKTRLFGKLAIPFHSEFEEVNLRFYVRREVGSEVRRGVVFIKEIVPKPAIALTARIAYGENYISLPMSHKVEAVSERLNLEYAWKHEGNWAQISASTDSAEKLPAERSLEQYITEHYWGYSKQKSGGTVEYRVEHESWPVRGATAAQFAGDATGLYGKDFGRVVLGPPDSAHIAEGSSVRVYRGHKIA